MLKNCFKENTIEVGCDEAGRGCLAGPVSAAAVILPATYSNPLLNDSKKLPHKLRNKLRAEIEEAALDYAVVFVDNREIDEINIFKASLVGMHRAIDRLRQRPQHILVDGNKFFPYQDIPHTCIIKGDGKYMSIAAASILAKTYRDEYMETLHRKHTCYGWDTNKGYPTKYHRKAIMAAGISPYHRRSFQLTDKQMSLDFTKDEA